jgi:hypothetical protein
MSESIEQSERSELNEEGRYKTQKTRKKKMTQNVSSRTPYSSGVL